MKFQNIFKDKLMCSLLLFQAAALTLFFLAIPLQGLLSPWEQPLLALLIFCLTLLLSIGVTWLLSLRLQRSSLCVICAVLTILLFSAGVANLIRQYAICGYLLMLLLMGFYFGLCALIWKVTGLCKAFERREGWICGVLALLLGLVVIGVFNYEDFIYYWDYSGYWTMALDTSQAICQRPQGTLQWLYTSVCVDEYNRWIPLLTGIPLQLLGRTYGAYIATLVLTFLMPTAATYAALTQMLMSRGCKKRITTPWLFAFFAFSGAMLLPTLNGYADAACILLIAVLTALAVYTDLTRFQPLELVLMGLTISHLALMRRSYDYWILTFAVACVVLTLIRLLQNKGQARKQALQGALGNLTVILGLGVVVFICFFRYIQSALSLDVGFAYQAWSATRTYDSWADFIQNYGLVILGAAVVGIFLVRGADILQTAAVVACCICVGLLMLQTMTSSPFALHSYYWITGQILLLAGMGLYAIYGRLAARSSQCFLAGLVLFISAGFLHSIHIITIPAPIQTLFPAKYYAIKQSDTKDDVLAVLNTISMLPEECPSIYVLGTDSEFNDDILRNANLPNHFNNANIFTTAHVDFREGFYTTLLDAEYVLTISPTEYHLTEEYQKVVAIPSQLIGNEDSAFSQCYEEVANVPFEDRVVNIYKRVKPVDLNSVRELEAAFDTVYPEYPDLFHNRFEQYIAVNQLV